MDVNGCLFPVKWSTHRVLTHPQKVGRGRAYARFFWTPRSDRFHWFWYLQLLDLYDLWIFMVHLWWKHVETCGNQDNVGVFLRRKHEDTIVVTFFGGQWIDRHNVKKNSHCKKTESPSAPMIFTGLCSSTASHNPPGPTGAKCASRVIRSQGQ